MNVKQPKGESVAKTAHLLKREANNLMYGSEKGKPREIEERKAAGPM